MNTLQLTQRTETLVREREKFEIEGVRDRDSQLYTHYTIPQITASNTKRKVRVSVNISFEHLCDLTICFIYHNPLN